MFCFTELCNVFTDKGPVSIKNIRIGDKVLTREGVFKPVTNVMNRKAEVITRKFSNGTKLTGTPDHKFITKNRGNVKFSELTEEDELLWLKNNCWVNQRLLLKIILCFTDILNQKIGGIGILRQGISRISDILIKNYMYIYGKNTMIQDYLKDIAFIIKTKIQQTMISRIWNWFQKLNIIQYIRKICGKLLDIMRTFVLNVMKSLCHVAPRNQRVSIVASDAEKKHTEKETVYNITVAGNHNYYGNSINVKNCDEELPEQLWGELQARLRATRGYYHQVFTATIGQEIWRCTIEERGKLEMFKDAFKRQVSLYDCQEYADGTLSPWINARIKEEITRCGTHTEVERRIFGKFVVEGGLKYPAFDRKKHIKDDHKTPKNWVVYAAVDIGSGGKGGHPAAIVFISVSPDHQKGRVIKCWRGDDEVTTAADILLKYQELRGDMKPVQQTYDWASKDFVVIANRVGEPFNPAEKNHEIGEHIVNSLFANNMMYIYDSGEESRKLVAEMVGLRKDMKKNLCKDDLCDAFRYACTSIPWDFSCIKPLEPTRKVRKGVLIDDRDEFIKLQKRGIKEQPQEIQEALQVWTEEANEWGEYHGDSY